MIDSNIKFMRVIADDPRFGHKAGDIVIVNTNYYLYPEKVICVGKLDVRNNHSFYLEQLAPITAMDLGPNLKPAPKVKD